MIMSLNKVVTQRCSLGRLVKLQALITSVFTIAVTLPPSSVFAQSTKVPVILSKVAKQQIIDRVQALGTLRANEQVTITAQVTETVNALHFDDGQRVKKGDVLAEMTSAEEAAQYREMEATVKEAKQQLERAAPLAKRNITSEAVLSERRRNYETATAQLEAVKSRIADRTVRAPFGGVLGLRRVSVGALVQPGTVISTIDDDSVMKLDFTVPATYLETLSIGIPIEITAKAFAGRKFTGKITGIDSRVDPITRSITVRALVPNDDRALKAGILMTVEILKNQRQAIAVPEEAIIARGRDASVYVVDPKSDSPTVAKREVKIGVREEGIVEIVSGLSDGEFVIVDGALRVTPGQDVTVMAIDKGNEPLVKLIDPATSPPSKVN